MEIMMDLILTGIAAFIVVLFEQHRKKVKEKEAQEEAAQEEAAQEEAAQEEAAQEEAAQEANTSRPIILREPSAAKPVKKEQAAEVFGTDDPAAAAFLEKAEKMAGAAEIADAFAEEYNGIDNENVREMQRQLMRLKNEEHDGGNSRDAAIKKLKRYFRHNGRVFMVDRSAGMLVCPNCGKEQRSSRRNCFHCDALFSE